jgi:hypothetical protein
MTERRFVLVDFRYTSDPLGHVRFYGAGTHGVECCTPRASFKFAIALALCRGIVWEMENDLQEIWAGAISNQYKAYALVIPNKQNKWLVFWSWKVSTEEIDPSPQSYIVLPVSDILARVTNETEQARQH